MKTEKIYDYTVMWYDDHGQFKKEENVIVFSKEELKQLLIDFSYSSINDVDEFLKRNGIE